MGAGRDTNPDSPDLPVVKTADGRPYIPGSSLKGAWRSYTEALLRTVQKLPEATDDNLTCFSVPRPQKGSLGVCLTQAEVSEIKERHRGDETSMTLDTELRAQSCWVCRVFGAPWLAGKLLVKDLLVDEATFLQTRIRDGVAIDRDTGRAAEKRKYAFEVVPAGAQFTFEAILENGSQAELGLAMLGVQALRHDKVQIGGARSRGLGWCHLEIDWDTSRYIDGRDELLNALFPSGEAAPGGFSEAQILDWIGDFCAAVGLPRPKETSNV